MTDWFRVGCRITGAPDPSGNVVSIDEARARNASMPTASCQWCIDGRTEGGGRCRTCAGTGKVYAWPTNETIEQWLRPINE